MSIFTIDKFCSKDIPSRADYNEIGLELTYSRSGSEDYYFNSNSDTLLAALVGSGSHKLNLGSMPKPGDYQALMSGINPRTNQVFCSKTRQTQLQTDNHALAGFSTSFNVEKSLSLLYATLPRDQQMKFEQAMMEAASRTIQHLEEGGHFAYRTGAQGSESHPGEVVAATYLHFTNRNQEPHLHVHAEIPNLILGIDGQWRTLDARELYRRQVEIGALFDASLASILQRDLPEVADHLECAPERSGLVVAGIDRNTVMRFSTRRQEIQDGLQAMGASGADAARAVAKRSRQAKAGVEGTLLREEWKSCLSDFSPTQGDLTPATLLAVEAMVFKNSSVFKLHDLDRAAAMLSILHGGIGSLPEIESAVAQQLGVVRLSTSPGEESLFTTETFRQLEVDLLRFARKASGHSQHFALSDLQIRQALRQCEQEKGFPLRYEQVQAMVHATDGRQIAIIQGAAGTGKSASLAALNIAYGSAGHRVLGLAPSGAAAAELQKSSGIESQTIHALLMRLENGNAQKPLHLTDRDIIVLDEAGMVDTRTLHKLLSHVEAAGAKIVLVGDSKQLEAVGSASTLHMLTQHLGSARLEQIARQRDSSDRAISQAWFSDTQDAPAMMQQRGLLRVASPDQPSPFEQMLIDAAQVHKEGTVWNEILLLADRNRDVTMLNQRVREIRMANGELDSSAEKVIQVSSDKGYTRQLALCPGDRIMLRKNAKLDGTPVFNGDRASVTRIECRNSSTDESQVETLLHARLDRSGAEICWRLGDYDKLDHAYAMTVHKSQGLTVEHAFYLVSETTDRRSAYVAFTRAKEACPFYLSPVCESAFANRTSAFKSKMTALDADPETKIRDMPVNEKTIAYAKSIRELVVDEIKRGVFDYQRRFPDSVKVTKAMVVDQVESPLPVQPAIAVPIEMPSSPTTGGMTVKEGVMLWLRVAQSGLASTTYLNYKCKAGHVIRYFGDTAINEVTIQELKLFRNHLVKPLDGSKGLSPKTVNDVLTVVRGVWADAKSNQLITTNHMEGIQNHKVKYKSLADPFTREQIKRIQHADPLRLREARVVVMNCWAGLSRSEMMGLAREDVDLDNKLIHVRRAYVDGIYRVPKEESRERFVELIKPAAELMALVLEDTVTCQPQQIDVTQRDNLTSEPESVTFLFRDWTTGNAWHPDRLDEWFKEHLVKSKVNHRGINQCRHTFASQALSSHVTLEWLAKQLGHADTTMIKKHYAKLIPSDTKRMAHQVSEQMGFGEDWSGV